jgi:hypothetical protein
LKKNNRRGAAMRISGAGCGAKCLWGLDSAVLGRAGGDLKKSTGEEEIKELEAMQKGRYIFASPAA